MVLKGIIGFLKKKKVRKNSSRIGSSKKKNKKLTEPKKVKSKKTKEPINGKGLKKEKLIAYATHYFSKIRVAVLKMKDTLEINNKIRIKGFTTDFIQTVSSMQIDHKPVKIAKKGQEVGLLVKGKVRHKDKVYKV